LLAVLIWAGAPLVAEVIDINVSDEAVRLAYIFQFESSGLEVDTSWLHHDDEDADVGAVGLQIVEIGGEASGPWSVGLGGRLFYVKTDAEDGSGLGLGGHVGYRPRRLQRFEVALHTFYSPAPSRSGTRRSFWTRA